MPAPSPVLSPRTSLGRTAPALVMAAVVLWVGSSSLCAQSAEDVVADAVARWQAQVAGVENFTVARTVMGTETVTYYEKRTEDGVPFFEEVGTSAVGGAAGVPGGSTTEGGIDLGQLKNTLIRSAADAGMQALARELTDASENQVAGLLGSLGQQIQQGAGGGGGLPGGIGAALGRAAGVPGGGGLGDAAGRMLGALGGTGGLQGALVQAAAEAGLRGLSGLLQGAAPDQLAGLLGGLERAGGLGGIEQLGDMAAQHGIQALLGGKVPGLGGPGGAAMGALGQTFSGDLSDPAAPSRGQVEMYPDMAQGQQLPAGMFPRRAAAGESSVLPAMQMFGDSSEITAGAVGTARLFRALRDHASLRGREVHEGKDVFVLIVEELGSLGPDALPDLAGTNEFRPRSLTVYLDRDEHLLRGMRVDGTGTVEGEERELTITVTPGDYREVEGMLYPFRTTVSVEGIGSRLSDGERAQMERARQQYEMMQQQMEQMPAQQRAMMERMMEQRFPEMEEMMESMAGGGALEMEVEVTELRVNEGPPEGMEVSRAAGTGVAAVSGAAGEGDADRRPGADDGAAAGGSVEEDAAPQGETATVGRVEMEVDGETMIFDVRQGPREEGFMTAYGETIRGESYVIGATIQGWHRGSDARILISIAFDRESLEHYCDPFANQVRFRPDGERARSKKLRPYGVSSETCPPREGVAGITALNINLREARYDPEAGTVYVAGDFAGPLGREGGAVQVESATFEATLQPRESFRE